MSFLRRTVASKVVGLIVGTVLGATAMGFANDWFYAPTDDATRTFTITVEDATPQPTIAIGFLDAGNSDTSLGATHNMKEGGSAAPNGEGQLALKVKVDGNADLPSDASATWRVCIDDPDNAITAPAVETVTIGANTRTGDASMQINTVASDSKYKGDKTVEVVLKPGATSCSA